MKKKNFLLIALMTLASSFAHAQQWTVSSKTANLAMDAVVYIESVYPKAGHPGVNETISGSAFLIADSNRVYLVTAKHLVQALLYGKNQQSISTTISIDPTFPKDHKIIKLPVVADKDINKKPFVLSDDEEDLAIFSFQKSKYKPILAAILKEENHPIPIDSIDVNEHHPDESFFIAAYSVFMENWVNIRSKGLAPGTIKTYNTNSSLFIINWDTGQAHSGAPVILNDKLIGMVTHETGITSNADIIRDPYRRAKTATVVKIASLLPLLKKLQRRENVKGF